MSETTPLDGPSSKSGFPRWSDLTDASRYSIYAILISLFLIVTLWRSVKICGCLEKRTIVTEIEINEKGEKKEVQYEEIESTRIQLLWPFKVLTVLFHEMSHAMIGMATVYICRASLKFRRLGRVAYISVDAHEGGETQFKPPPARQPAYKPTLAAGYLGSCLIGCALLGAGFDALASKYAALALIFYLLMLLIICASIRTKSTLTHNRAKVSYWFHRIFGFKETLQDRLDQLTKKEKEVEYNEKRMKKLSGKIKEVIGRIQARGEEVDGEKSRKEVKREKEKDERELKKLEKKLREVAEVVYEEKMVSLDIICAVASIIVFLFILPWWLIADSAGLRFVILFIGLFSAVYAVQDIYDDSIKNKHVCGSDANAYARIMLGPMYLEIEEERTKVGREKVEVYEKEVRRRTQLLAWISLILQLVALLSTIILSLYLVRTTTAEQALRSRSFLPSPWHLGSADLLEQAQRGKEGLKDGMDWGKSKIGEVWSGDGE